MLPEPSGIAVRRSAIAAAATPPLPIDAPVAAACTSRVIEPGNARCASNSTTARAALPLVLTLISPSSGTPPSCALNDACTCVSVRSPMACSTRGARRHCLRGSGAAGGQTKRTRDGEDVAGAARGSRSQSQCSRYPHPAPRLCRDGAIVGDRMSDSHAKSRRARAHGRDRMS